MALSPALAAPVQLTPSVGTVPLGSPVILSWQVLNAFSKTFQNCYGSVTPAVASAGAWAGRQTGTYNATTQIYGGSATMRASFRRRVGRRSRVQRKWPRSRIVKQEHRRESGGAKVVTEHAAGGWGGKQRASLAAPWEVAFHFNKGLAGASQKEIAAARDTATNPAVLDAFACAFIAAEGPPAFDGIPGGGPDLGRAREDASRICRQWTNCCVEWGRVHPSVTID